MFVEYLYQCFSVHLFKMAEMIEIDQTGVIAGNFVHTLSLRWILSNVGMASFNLYVMEVFI